MEIDATTASIARLLYPGANIRQQGFEQTRLPDDAIDLVISKVPFGNYQVFDPDFNQHHFLIHDYYFAKALQKSRPGGLIAFITSILATPQREMSKPALCKAPARSSCVQPRWHRIFLI